MIIICITLTPIKTTVQNLQNIHYVNQMDNRIQRRFPKLSSQITGPRNRHLLDGHPQGQDKECAGNAPGQATRGGVCRIMTPRPKIGAPIHWGACVALCSDSPAAIRMGVSAWWGISRRSRKTRMWGRGGRISFTIHSVGLCFWHWGGG